MDKNQSKKEQLDLQRIQILYHQAWFTFIGLLVSAAVIVYTIYPKLPWWITLAWLFLALSVIPVRLALLSAFKADIKNGRLSVEQARLSEKRWCLSTAIPSTAFASSIYFPYSSDQLIIFLFIGLVLVSMIAGSIVSSITSKKTVMVFMNLSILPYIARCFMETGETYWTLGVFFIAFYMIFLSLALRMNQTVLEAIRQQIERQEIAYKDSLTGLWNRRKLFTVVESMEGKPYSLLLIDVDHFKYFNDKEGHTKGDEMLSEISLSILGCTQEKDLVVRYGGEEFLVLLPGVLSSAAERIAHQIRQRVIVDSTSTVSIGVADTELEKDFDALVELADKAMYQAKNDGRNCVRTANSSYLELTR